jgi:RNA polymerase sigma-70 factor (ECF subfamily)
MHLSAYNADPSVVNDPSFVARLRTGDGDAFEDMVRHHTGRLLRVARRFMKSEDEARDALQDAFLSVFRSIGRFEASARLSTWLHRITINACLMRLRTQRRRAEEDIESYLPRFTGDDSHAEPSVAGCESADTLIERMQLRRFVRASIDRLPATYREVLLLRDIEELSNGETATLLGVTPNAAKIRLHRARQALRAMLDPHMTNWPAAN